MRKLSEEQVKTGKYWTLFDKGSIDGFDKFFCWQWQLGTEKDGDTEKGCQKPAVQQKTTTRYMMIKTHGYAMRRYNQQ